METQEECVRSANSWIIKVWSLASRFILATFPETSHTRASFLHTFIHSSQQKQEPKSNPSQGNPKTVYHGTLIIIPESCPLDHAILQENATFVLFLSGWS